MSTYYGRSWDMYVTEVFEKMKRADSVYPGDEWGDPGWWNICYKRLLERAEAKDWQRAVEIGPGSGKYTTLLLERSNCRVLGFDVSEQFLSVLHARAAAYIRSRRLMTSLLSCVRPDEMLAKIEEVGWRDTVDAFFSIDSMVHVDLQYLAAYFVTAAICLRPGGKLILSLADGTSQKGLQKLLKDIKLCYGRQGTVSLKFEFLSPDLVRCVLESIGFKIDLLEHDSEVPGKARDIFLIASKMLTDASLLERYLR